MCWRVTAPSWRARPRRGDETGICNWNVWLSLRAKRNNPTQATTPHWRWIASSRCRAPRNDGFGQENPRVAFAPPGEKRQWIGLNGASAFAIFSPARAACTRPRSSTPCRRASPRISASRSACSPARSRRSPCSARPISSLLTLSEFAGQAYRICRAGNLALLVDADHGYGNALNVMRTVRGVGDGRRLRPYHRGHRAARRVRRARQAAAAADRGRRRQDARGTDGAAGQAPRHRRPHQRGGDHRHRRRRGARQGLRRGRRRRAVLRRSEDPRAARGDQPARSSCRSSSAAAVASSTMPPISAPRAFASRFRDTCRSWRRSAPCMTH